MGSIYALLLGSEDTRISQKFDKIYLAACYIVRLGGLSTNYLNVIASGIAYHGVLDEFHPVWYVFPRIYAL